MRKFAMMLIAVGLGACGSTAEVENAQVDLRNLVETDDAAPLRNGYRLQDEVIPTPSDPVSTYHLLRTRRTVQGLLVSIIRQQRGERVVYARTETDCERRLFHIVGVGESRGDVEADIARDGPLRSVEGLPLRVELATAICERVGTPLAVS